MNVIVVGEKLTEKGACPALRYIRSNGGEADLCFGSAHQSNVIQADRDRSPGMKLDGMNVGQEAGPRLSSAHRAVANRVESSGASGIGPDGINVCGEVSSATERLRGNLVEIIFSPASRKAAKPLKKMVGTTGIEPVTPTMSR